MRIFFALIFALSVFQTPIASAAKWQSIPGTPISLIPPQNFTLAEDFSGFINTGTKASILVAVFPPDRGKIIATLFNDHEQFIQAMRVHQFDIKKYVTEKTADGETIIIYSGTQKDGATVYDKWATLINGNGTYMITLQSPAEAKLQPEEALALFRSLKLGAQSSLEEQIAALPFSFKRIAPFHAKATLMGSAVMLETEQNTLSETTPVTLYIIRDPHPSPSGNTQHVQSLYLASIQQAFILKTNIEQNSVHFAGMTGQRLIGAGLNGNGKNEDIILYTALDTNNKAIYLQATGPAGTLTPLRQIIDEIARSISLKEKQHY